MNEEQRKCLLGLAKMGFKAQPAIKAANDFMKSMQQLEANAGHSNEQIEAIGQSLLNMAAQENEQGL
jgi:hypothetical protein